MHWREEREIKDEYLAEREKHVKAAMAKGYYGDVGYTMKELRILRKMALEHIVPDGRFGDDECIIWEMLGK